MIRDITERQFRRQSEPSVIPCPFRQLNELTNAGGYPEHSVNVILDKPKAKKTFFMINLCVALDIAPFKNEKKVTNPPTTLYMTFEILNRIPLVEFPRVQ